MPKKADRCEFAEQAVYTDGPDIGKAKWICHDPSCKDHLGRVPDTPLTAAGSRNGSAGAAAAATQHHARKQELFDLKVDEAVRKHVMREALKAFTWPLERQHLNEAVKEFFRRLPTDVQKVICEVFGWQDELAAQVRFSDETVLQELGKLDDNQLAQFLMLCSFAHYGANQYGGRQVDQSAVIALSQACGVNHTLIDAQVRAEFSPKKYKDAHRAYLEAVQKGQTAPPPVVYEPAA